MTEQEKFIQQVKGIRDYWLELPGKTTEDAVDGAIFSLLVMVDGCSGMNDFHSLKIIDTQTRKRLDTGCLHDMFCAALRADKQTAES